MAFIDDFEIDVVEGEDVQLDSDVTEYPVEVGADNADHIRPLPDVVVLNCIVSDTPIGPLATRRASSGLRLLKPTQEVYFRLKQIRESKRLVTVETGLDIYTSMALEGLSVPRSSRDGKSIRFQARFVKVTSATTELDTVLVAMPRAKKGADFGNLASPYQLPLGIWGGL